MAQVIETIPQIDLKAEDVHNLGCAVMRHLVEILPFWIE